jgi:flavin-dependent dehydrogenase
MCDVLIAGAGPAGAVAGAILARAGVRVRLVDRATFPRDKLCGDTVNPGTLARLRWLDLADGIDGPALRVDGMLLTGERGVSIEGRYPDGQSGLAILRRDLDWRLLQQAIDAGCQFDPGVAVRRATVDDRGASPIVTGVSVGSNGRESPIAARVTIAADGRRSTIAFGLGLARHPAHPRRWAIGAYYENFMPFGGETEPLGLRVDSESAPTSLRVGFESAPTSLGVGFDPTPTLLRPRADLSLPVEGQVGVRPYSDPGPTLLRPRLAPVFGEMHVRRGRYIGVAPVPDGLTNVCLVRPSGPGDAELADPASLLTRELARDPLLRDRASAARMAGPPVVLGPLAVDVRDAGIDGLLLAGDAAGFIDPMTGDGLRFAVRGGELAAAAALQALDHGWSGVHAQHATARRRDFGGKWRFNRALRALVASPRAVAAAALGARLAPAALRAAIAHAGDCHADRV